MLNSLEWSRLKSIECELRSKFCNTCRVLRSFAYSRIRRADICQSCGYHA